jgi:L-ascorbate metabolism protein UlaG (beta-lactamase superfamily)
MEITYRGGNCVEIAVKKETVVIDGGLSALGLKDSIAKEGVYIATQTGFNPSKVDDSLRIEGPGEYEVRGVSIKGIASQRMIELNDDKKATIYRLVIDGVSFAIVGHVRVPLTDDELEKIGVVDIAIVPVGGGGYTLDGHQAMKVVKQLEPKVVIPTHYADSAVHYEVPQNGLDEFIKELGAEHEKVTSYKVKGAVLPAQLTLVEIERS